MSDNKKIHLSVWIAWLVLHGYLLYFRFSLGALAVLALGALILFVCTYANGKYSDGYLHNTLGHVLGASLFVQLGWYFVEKILARFMLTEGWVEYFGEMWGLKIQGLIEVLLQGEEMMVPLGAAAALFFLRLCTSKKPRLSMLASYASSGALMYPLLNKLYHSHVIALLYTIVMLAFIWAELWNIAVEDERNKSAKRWFNLLTILLMLVHAWDWYMLRPLIRDGALESYFVIGATKWSHLLVAGVVLAGIIVMLSDISSDEAWPQLKILTAVASMLLLTAFLKWFYVGWWWILVLANGLYLLADPLILHPVYKDDEDAVIGEWTIQLCLAVLSLLLVVTGHFGTWPLLLALLGSAVLFGIGVVKFDEMEEDPPFVLLCALFLFALVLVPAVVWMWMYRRLAYSFHLLLILAAVTLVIAGLLSWSATAKDRNNVLAPTLVTLLFAVLALNLCATGGSRIDMELDARGVPVVQAEARGEDNRVVSTEYFWTEDWLDLDGGDFAVNKEEPITRLNRLANKEGKLRVVVTDRYGITTETVFWLHTQPNFHNG